MENIIFVIARLDWPGGTIRQVLNVDVVYRHLPRIGSPLSLLRSFHGEMFSPVVRRCPDSHRQHGATEIFLCNEVASVSTGRDVQRGKKILSLGRHLQLGSLDPTSRKCSSQHLGKGNKVAIHSAAGVTEGCRMLLQSWSSLWSVIQSRTQTRRREL